MNDAVTTKYSDELLTPERERELILRWQNERDPRALELLTSSYRRLVIKIARGFKGYNLPLEDLISEGNIGLIKAIDRFDCSRELRLSTYAVWWIRAVIQEYVLQSWSKVKIGLTASQKKLFFNLRRLKRELLKDNAEYLDDETAEEIAKILGVKVRDVLAMEGRLSGGDYSLDSPMNAEGSVSWLDNLADEGPGPAEITERESHRAMLRRWLQNEMQKLRPREREIIAERRLSETPKTLDTLADRFKVSRERIRQIERRALEKLTLAAKTDAIQGLAV